MAYFDDSFQSVKFSFILLAAQLSIPRATIHDTTIAGYRVPKHTLVIAHLASIHLDPKLFKDPLDFHPERFLDEKGQFKNPDFYNPYGFGK